MQRLPLLVEGLLTAKALPVQIRGIAEQVATQEVKYVTGINIKKGGSDPEIKALSEYPDWLPALATSQASLYELRQTLAVDGRESMTSEEVLRMAKLWRRQKVKDHNDSKSKKKA